MWQLSVIRVLYYIPLLHIVSYFGDKFVAFADKHPCVAVTRGVGCIFTEMVSGSATFPGTKDAWDQLDRIWQVGAFSRGWLILVGCCASWMQQHVIT